MRITGWKIPEVAFLDVSDVSLPVGIKQGDAAGAIGNDRPFSRQVPMHLPDRARGKPHVHARNGFGNLEIGPRYLTRPTTILRTSRGVVERCPELRKIADIGWRRIECPGELARNRLVPRAGVD
jgi:hypothetical protein